MPTRDQTRIADDRARPRLMELWWALRPLKSVIRFMQTGAHPDDETSGMLAALSIRDGINISYACSTRGEGGQNDIGTETGAELGALRTREMEAACRVLGMRMYWHSTHPDDSIVDFGFSKSGDETLAHWGHDRTILRFAEIVRTDRPDIVCPTFLDVPGQHGHHRAMTAAAHAVMSAAADPALPSNLPPWRVKKMYLPAWSGAGQSYDDDRPPPEATLTILGHGRDPMTGWSWERIGQQSRAFHRTQGMGRWTPPGHARDWPLHLAECHVAGPDDALWSGLPSGVAALADLPGAAPIADLLRAAGAAIDATLATYPDFAAVAGAATEAHRLIRAAREACPVAVADEVLHRLADKAVQLGHVMRLALGIEARIRVRETFLPAGAAAGIETEIDPGLADATHLSLDLPDGWTVSDDTLSISRNVAPHDPYRAIYDPALPPAPRLNLHIQTGGEILDVTLPFDNEPVILPAARAAIAPSSVVLNTNAPGREFDLTPTGLAPKGGRATLRLPPTWHASQTEAGFRVRTPDAPEPGTYTLGLTIDGQPAATVQRIAYDHIAPAALIRPAEARVAVCDVALPDARVAYIGAGNDRVGHWLAAVGADVTDLSEADLSRDGVFSGFDSIVIGIFALRFRQGLAEAIPTIHRWVEAGGTLVTLYHRPWDNWDPNTTPPRRIEIGQPSLRWRVTDQNAPVTHLADHAALRTPNAIGPADWRGWAKERGLYFAKSWDDAYTPLLEMADPGEAPHRGALLAADIGNGRHIHTSLILHHQMERLVEGGFRLMANLIAPRE